MGSVDPVDGWTFKVSFTADGEAKLKERVNDKLKEFMGGYSDDVLVEYVIVLLRNGRHRDEARKDLNVFLGDDSVSFVSWLWDHLASNLDLYIPSQETLPEEAAKKRSLVGTAVADIRELDSSSEVGRTSKLDGKRHNKGWKGLVRNAAEPPPLRSSEVENINFVEKNNREVSKEKSPSPRYSQKKRSRADERQPIKREAISRMAIDAPKRLLQFAVRDAVGNSQALIAQEPSSKRLHSVVSTSSGDSYLPDHARRFMSVARVPNPMATVIKAAAEAAEDVSKVKTAGRVFDRHGSGMDFLENHNRHAELREYLGEDEDYGDFNQSTEKNQSAYLLRNDFSVHVGGVTMSESQTGLAFDTLSDNEGYDVNIVGDKLMNVCETGTPGGNEGDKSLMVQYSVPKDDEVVQRTEHKDHDKSTAADNTSRKIVDIDVNINSWKPPHHQVPRNVSDLDVRKYLVESEAIMSKSNIRLIKENANNVTVGSGNVMKRSSANQEAAPVMTWSRSAWGAPPPFAAARFARAPFVRGMHGAFRPHLPMKLGARSLQWKRDAQAIPSEAGASATGNSFSSRTARSLTYIRSEPKPEGNASST